MSNKSEKTLVERYDLPATVDGICGLVRDILEKGSVASMNLTVGDSVRVKRVVETDELTDEIKLGWDGVLRNLSTLEELPSDEKTPHQIVFDLMDRVAFERLVPVAWVTGLNEQGLLADWLRARSNNQFGMLLNIPVHRLRSLPEETLILCAARHADADPEEVVFATKTTIELRSSYEPRELASSEDDRGSGHRPRQRHSTAQVMAPIARGLRKVQWP